MTFSRLIRIGRDPAMEPSQARYVVLTNIMALLSLAFTVGFAPVLVLTGTWIYPALQLVYALAYLPTLWLNHRGKHVAATTWFLLGGQLMVAAQVMVGGGAYDVQLFFLLHTMLPCMLYAPRHNRAMFALTALAGAELIAVFVFANHLPQLGPAIAANRLAVIMPVLLGGLFITLAVCAYYARSATLIAEQRLDAAHARSEALLLNILPSSIATRLKASGGTIADGFAEVTVLFADIVGFTKLSSRLPPERIVEMLNDLFCHFDDLADQLGLEKIKTIGDCYMVAGGLPLPRADHASIVVKMGLAMLRTVREFSTREHETLDIRVGIHTGPVVAGVIGKRKFIYDMWGDTVNIASRMESHGVAGAIQVSDDCRRHLDASFDLTKRGSIEVKGKGPMETWLLRADPAPVTTDPAEAVASRDNAPASVL